MPIYLITDYEEIKGTRCEYVAEAVEGPAGADLEGLRRQWRETPDALQIHHAEAEAFVAWLKQQPGWGTVQYTEFNIKEDADTCSM